MLLPRILWKKEFDLGAHFAEAMLLPTIEVRKIVIAGIISRIAINISPLRTGEVLPLAEKFKLGKDEFDSACKEGFSNVIRSAYGVYSDKDDLSKLQQLREDVGLAEEIFAAAAEKALLRIVKGITDERRFDDLSRTSEQLRALIKDAGLAQDTVEGLLAAQLSRGLSENRHSYDFRRFVEFIQSLQLSEATLRTLAKTAFLQCLESDTPDHAVEILNLFNIDTKELQDEKIVLYLQPLFNKLVLGSMGRGYSVYYNLQADIDRIKVLSKDFPALLQEPHRSFLISNIAELLGRNLSEIFKDDLMLIVPNVLGLTDEAFKLPEFQKDAEEFFLEKLERADDAQKAADMFAIPRNRVEALVSERIVQEFEASNYSYPIAWCKTFNLPAERFQKEALGCLISRLTSGQVQLSEAMSIKESFSLNGKLDLPEVKTAAKTWIAQSLKEENVEQANLIESEFKVAFSTSDAKEHFPHFEEVLKFLSDRKSDFLAEFNKSNRLLFILCTLESKNSFFESLQSAPFLADAVVENSRFAPRLIKAWGEFDEESRKKIEILYLNKTKILQGQTEQSRVEFRSAMQELLRKFGKNREILSTITTVGINTEEWLGHREKEEFVLTKESEETGVYERLAVPTNRITETTKKYEDLLKQTLEDHKQQLSSATVSDVKVEAEAELEVLQAKLIEAEAANDERRSKGIQRGIENAMSRAAKAKLIPVLDKIRSGINNIAILRGEVTSKVSALRALESKSADTLLVGEAETIKRSLNESASKLEKTIQRSKKEITELLGTALSEEVSSSVLENINLSLREEWITFDSDITDIRKLTSKEVSENLDGRQVHISVWDRNPDMDLYQGNYSPCCISIESGAGGESSESTIADYLTDLGVQIVSIYDTEKNIPIAAAWCWIGTSKVGTTSLIIDNIEANTDYSNQYAHLLGEKLVNYIVDYGKKIGADRVELGTAHNDLPDQRLMSRMRASGKRYLKTGGYNRADGYFLEAEDTKVVTVWKRE